MIYTSALAHKFVIYLYKNKHLDGFNIQKRLARDIYYQQFRKEQKTHVNFGTVFHHTLSFLRKQPDHSFMIFKQNKLLNLLKKEDKIDSVFHSKSPVKKKTLISDNVVSQQDCKLCGVKFENVGQFEEHLGQEEHQFLEEFHNVLKTTKRQPDLQFTIDDSPTLDNIILRKDTPKLLSLKIKNTTKQPMTLTSIQTNKKIEEVTFETSCPYKFPPLSIMQFELSVRCKNEGIMHYPLLFATESAKHATELVFHTHNEFFDDLHPTEPYKPRVKPVFREFIEEVDSGERPNIFPQVKNLVPLKQYQIPAELDAVLNSGLKSEQQLEYIKAVLGDRRECRLTRHNYTELLDLLLYMEEHQMHKNIRDYDQEDQVLKKDGTLFELEVPGLAEHRPSVILADAINLMEMKQGRILYKGFVHKVKESSVLLKFSKRFESSVFLKGKKFYVSFTFNRYPLRVEHQAVEFARIDNIAHLFFPTRIRYTPPERPDLNWFNRDIGNNEQQQQAVRSVLKKTAMPAPYLIFGPPGTGKTMTVVEAVKQIHKLTKENVLICAPSNSAANEVTRRLITSIPTTDLFRFIAASFPYHLIPENVRKYSNFAGGEYYQPLINEFVKYRIVVTTLVSAAKLVNSKCPQDHFGYVFIDEAGQATESETLIAVARILTSGAKSGTIGGQVVLAGDPRQLGPIIHSTLAKKYGFGISMLERLMDTCKPYEKNGAYNPNAVTKLLKNYRSHSVIVNQPNQLFYDNELEVAGDDLINVALNSEILPNKKFPMIFHSVAGEDQREKMSPSFFNIQEVQIVFHYLEKLIGSRLQGMNIKEEHVGVVTPYKKQVEKIRKSCAKKYNDKLFIGSVEQFQGQERLIIIISTVRSKADMRKFDRKFNLGFLDNPKRFNVAITRAKALLIIIGNPNVLQADQNWRSLIKYCYENGAVVGEKFDLVESTTEDEESLSDIDNMSLFVQVDQEEVPSFSRGIN